MIADLLRLASGALALTRPLNCGITAVSVLVGALTSGFLQWSDGLALATLSAALLTGAGNAYNDLLDLDIDRVNRPHRPLPSGRVSPHAARREAVTLGAIGLALAWWLGPICGVMASTVALGLVAYSHWLKRAGLAGNVVVSSLAAAAFPYGALAMGALGRSWVPAGFAFLYHLGREVAKDVEDMEGDRHQGTRSLALTLGARRARRVSATILSLLGVSAVVPWAAGMYGSPYLSIIVVLWAIVGAALTLLLIRPRPAGDQTLSRLLTAGMAVGLAAIAAGELL
ncbi:geranylgeranylglycerol-phosphate geranylgeranyltransferase [Candidatus Latescibacterota bacterium]